MKNENIDGELIKLIEDARLSIVYKAESAKFDFADEVIRLMDGQRITKFDLAKRLGKSPSYVLKIICGEVSLTIEAMVSVAEALNSKLKLHLELGKINKTDEK